MRLIPLVLLAACGDGSSETAVLYDPTLPAGATEAASWLSFPFPADHRRTDAGTVDLGDFPNPGRNDTIDLFTSFAGDELEGFSTVAPAYVAFSAPVDASSLPSEPGAFIDPAAPLQLIDVTAGSPTYGRRVPLRWELFTDDASYVVANTLAVGPAWGFPLRPVTTYALIVTDALRGADGKRIAPPPVLSALLGDRESLARATGIAGASLYAALEAQFRPLRDLAEQQGLADGIIAATVFTTQDTISDLGKLYDWVQAQPSPQVDASGWQVPTAPGAGAYWTEHTFEWNRAGDTVDFWRMEGRYATPYFQVGTLPFASRGGALSFVDGEPVPVRTETIRFVLTFPKLPPADGGAAYPIAIVAHGTGGNAYSFFDDDTAGRLAARGIAGISIEQPLHPPRHNVQGLVELYTFNYLNPEAARANFLQSAVDSFWLARIVRGSLAVPAAQSPTQATIRFDGERLGFFGHSQGGLSGALAASYERNVDAWMLSAAGGIMAITLNDRNDPQFLGIRAVLLDDSMFPLPTDELTYLHPIASLVQTLVDVADPINYAPLWFQGPPRHSILLTSGHHDQQTPHRAGASLAVAGRLPQVLPIAPAIPPIPEYAAAGIPPVRAPVQGNIEGATAGFIQYTDDIGGQDVDTHFLVFERREARHASMRFLQSALYGPGPVIERLSASDAN